MADQSVDLEYAETIGLLVRYNAKGIANKLALQKYALRTDITAGSNALMGMLEEMNDSVHLPNINYLSGLAIASNLQWEALARKMAKFNAEWDMYEERTRRPRGPRAPRERQGPAEDNRTLEDILEGDIIVPELPRREDEELATALRDQHVLPAEQEVPLPAVDETALDQDDMFDFGGIINEEDLFPAEGEITVAEPEAPVDGPPPAPIDETRLSTEVLVPREETRHPAAVHVVPRRTLPRRQTLPGRQKVRTELEEIAAAFHQDYHEAEALEFAELDDSLFACLMPRFKVVKLPVGELGTADDPSVMRAGVSNLGTYVDDDDLAYPDIGNETDVVPVDMEITMGHVPLPTAGEELVEPQTIEGAGITHAEDDMALPQVPQLDTTFSVAGDIPDDLLQDRLKHLYALRGKHPGMKLTIRDLTPLPHNRIGVTTTFMLLPDLHRKKVLEISTDAGDYLTTVEFL